MKQVIMYTDGACRGNPGPGGWGVLLKFNGTQKEIFGGSLSTTNNKMELKAAIEGLRLLSEPCSINLYTDLALDPFFSNEDDDYSPLSYLPSPDPDPFEVLEKRQMGVAQHQGLTLKRCPISMREAEQSFSQDG